MKSTGLALLALFTSAALHAEPLDYLLRDGRFETTEGVIPNGCFAQLMTELNGDNTVAAVFLNRAALRGCIAANFPYPGGDETRVSYTVNEALANDTFRLTVCQTVDGSLRASCDRILVRFVNRPYRTGDTTTNVLSLEKLGEW